MKRARRPGSLTCARCERPSGSFIPFSILQDDRDLSYEHPGEPLAGGPRHEPLTSLTVGVPRSLMVIVSPDIVASSGAYVMKTVSFLAIVG